MILTSLRLRSFRNYTSLDVNFLPGFHLFMGNNGQGKSNLLEAIYLLSTLRSFRGVPNAQMVAAGQKGYFIGGTIQAERKNEVKIYWSRTERRLSLNAQQVTRLSDFYGTMRAVIFCAEDMQLIKGAPADRRRYMDFLLAQTDSNYLNLLQRYTCALRSRNALLKQSKQPNRSLLDSFSQELILSGKEIIARRTQLLAEITPLICNFYSTIADSGTETIRLSYRPNVLAENFPSQLNEHYPNELLCRYTLIGPHRDDLDITLNNLPAAKCASEGQKRTLAIALKMTQAEYLSQKHGIMPILLIDDVMGELDARRRQSFLPLLNKVATARGQMFMTCTEQNWQNDLGINMAVWKICAGQVLR